MSVVRSRWAAIGAAVAVSLGAGGIGLVSATVSSGDRAVFIPIAPCRIADTRPATQVGPKASPIGPNETHTITAWGNCTIPTDATALSLNVTALGATANTFLTIWGAGTRPDASSLNPRAGAGPNPNAVTTPLTTDGRFNIYNATGNVNVIIDINGYYANHNHDDRYYTKSQTNDQIAAAISTAATPQRLTTGAPFTLPPYGCAIVFVYGVGGVPAAGGRVGFWIENADGSMPLALNNEVLYKAASIGRTSQGGTLAWGEFCSLSPAEKSVPAGWVIKTTVN